MAKRKRITQDEDESESASDISSKRSKTRSSRVHGTNMRDTNSKENSYATDHSSEGDLNETENVAIRMHSIYIDDFERQYGPKMHARFEKAKLQDKEGVIADCGIIEYVEMHQFMCHRYLCFTFGPRINFIIGHNGSGKSAVLSAITIALGGKTKSTGRGTGLKTFIREGQGAAEVTLHLKNRGLEPFKHDQYGNRIIITRKFTKQGSSTWKIKNEHGKVVSTKKEELTEICDYMHIQVDNPVTILTQDSARKFLGASSPEDKYQFFLRGTQLAQLSEEYDSIRHNINKIEQTLKTKKAAIPDLEARLIESKSRYAEASKAKEQKRRQDDLKKELAWSYVAGKKLEFEAAIQKTAISTRAIEKIQENLDKAKAALDNTSALVIQLQQESKNENLNHLQHQGEQIAQEMSVNKTKLHDFTSDEQEMRRSIEVLNDQVGDYDKKIDDENRRCNNQAKYEENQRHIREVKSTIDSLTSKLNDLAIKKRDIFTQANVLLKAQPDNEKKAEIENNIIRCNHMIESARKAQSDALLPFGNNMKALLAKIKSTRWFGDVPLGPLGRYVTAKDPKTWGDILRNRLGSYLISFAITDARDQPQLKRLLNESNNKNHPIIIYEKDLFDFGKGEPPKHLHTALRELEISDQYVLRLLINHAHIERHILAKTRGEADNILRALPGGGYAWTTDFFNVRVFPEGGISSVTLYENHHKGAMNLLLTGRDSAGEITHLTAKRERLECERREIDQKIEAAAKQHALLMQKAESFNNEQVPLQKELFAAKSRLAELEEAFNEDKSIDIQSLEDNKQEIKQEIENIEVQLAHVIREKTAMNQQQHVLRTRLNDIRTASQELESQQEDIEKKIEDAAVERENAKNSVKHYEKKLEDERKVAEDAQAASDVVEEELKSWTAKALERCEEIPNPRETEIVKRNIASISKALTGRELELGASVDVLRDEVDKATINLGKVKKELKFMQALHKALDSSLETRLDRWVLFRAINAVHCKIAFQSNLSNRGYFGRIEFNHVAATLKLHVETDDQHQTHDAREKDPFLLSGGEKSFTTICLLLSLWDCITCPLRCLDEFDVFMDAVNRRISMKMLIDTAKKSDKKQYIFITPQDMTNIMISEGVKVHRMSDPERRAI